MKKRSKQNLSHYRLTTGYLGQLLPIACVEVLPGDTFQHATNVLLRFTPLVRPIMHRVELSVQSFFVPYRLLWDNWEKFITNQSIGEDTFPTVAVPDSPISADYPLLDRLGLPAGYDEAYNVSALPVRAYNKIWNEFFRDNDLQTERTTDQLTLANVNYARDYFTGARAVSQQGSEVTFSLGASADVVFPSNPDLSITVDGTGRSIVANPPGSQNINYSGSEIVTSSSNAYVEMPSDAYADLTSATPISIRDLRLASALQNYQESLSRYGSRYTELLRHLGVRPSDSRLQRPEYLGGGRTYVSVSEVLQTAEGTTTPVGEMVGHGISGHGVRPYRKYFEEHGVVLTVAYVRPQSVYALGLDRMWLHGLMDGVTDFWTPELQHIGEQEILQQEITGGVTDGMTTVFGYGERYGQYRHQMNLVTGEFRDTHDDWHLARLHADDPTLNSAFISCDADEQNDLNRPFASSATDTVLLACQHKIIARRPVSNTTKAKLI